MRDVIYAIRTTSGREEIVIDLLTTKIRASALAIKAILHPAEIKGYIFIEGKLGEVQKTVRGVMHVRGVIETPIKLDEIQHFLEHKKATIKITEGNIGRERQNNKDRQGKRRGHHRTARCHNTNPCHHSRRAGQDYKKGRYRRRERRGTRTVIINHERNKIA